MGGLGGVEGAGEAGVGDVAPLEGAAAGAGRPVAGGGRGRGRGGGDGRGLHDDGGGRAAGRIAPNGAVHVADDLRVLQRPTVDPDLVDAAQEAVAARAAGADPQRPAGPEELAGGRGARDLDATHEQAHRAAVVGRGQVGPASGLERGAGAGDVRGGAGVDDRLRTSAGRVEGVGHTVAALLHHDGARAVGAVRANPGLERHGPGGAEGCRVRDDRGLGGAVHAEGAPEAPGLGARGGGGAVVRVVRGVGHPGAGALVEAVGRDGARGGPGHRRRSRCAHAGRGRQAAEREDRDFGMGKSHPLMGQVGFLRAGRGGPAQSGPPAGAGLCGLPPLYRPHRCRT